MDIPMTKDGQVDHAELNEKGPGAVHSAVMKGAIPRRPAKGESRKAPKEPKQPKAPKQPKTKKAPKEKKPRAPKAAAGPSPFLRDSRLPKPGSVIEKTWHGRTLRVKVTETGLEFGGKEYRSLSAIGSELRDGKATNGYAFFGLDGPGARNGAAKGKGAKRSAPKAAGKAEEPAAAPAPTEGVANASRRRTKPQTARKPKARKICPECGR